MGGFPGTAIPLVPGAGLAVAPSLPLIPQARPEAHGGRSRSAGPCGRHRAVGEVEGVEVSLTVCDLDRRAGLVEGDLGGGGFGHATGRVVEIVQPHLLQGERGRRRGAFAEGRGAERDEPGGGDDDGDDAHEMLRAQPAAPRPRAVRPVPPDHRPHLPLP